MRRSILAAIVAAMMLFMGVGVANASGDVTSPASCHLSANWKVLFSARYTDRNSTNTIGYFDYLVINSPGVIHDVAVDVIKSTSSGDLTALIRDGAAAVATHRDTSKPAYVYRYDPNLRVYTANVKVTAASGASCTVNIDPSGNGTLT